MKKSTLLTLCTLLVVSFSVSAQNTATQHPHWSYEGDTDPAHWAELDHANSACKLSKEQSPINIEERNTKKTPLAVLNFNYLNGPAEVINNGHTVQVNLPVGSTLKVGNDSTSLLQFHFHTPSEEQINGIAYPMVAHFVHKSKDGKLSVVAVLFKEGKENLTLAPVFANLPAEGKPVHLMSFNPIDVLPQGRSYFKFMGSLTTPPCSDGVRWQVLQQTVDISKEQIAAFRTLYKMNARPVQPLNGRIIEQSE